MALWNNVNSCDIDSETVSFGTRQFAQAGDSLYECSTLAVITPDSDQAESPLIKSFCHENLIYLAIDNSVTLLSNDSCQHISSNIYQAPINCFTICKTWNMLIICFQNGEILGFDIHDNTLMFQVSVPDECKEDIKTFLNIIQQSNCCIILTSSGTAYRLSINLNLSGVEQIDTNATDKFSFEAINDIELHKPYPIAAVSCDTNSNFIFGGSSIQKANVKNVIHIPMVNSSIKKLGNIQYTNYILCLLDNGKMNLLHANTLFMCPIHLDIIVDDFIIIKTPEPDTCNILLSCENSKRLMLVDFPSMKEIYSIYVKNKIVLMDFIDIPMDIKFIEYVEDLALGKEIRIRALTETCPEFRLHRLIKRERFDEAEILINQFKLSMDEIHKAKANLELKKYWESVEKISSENFDKLINLMDNISDNSCIAAYCLQALQYDSFDIVSVQKLLEYALRRIKEESDLDNYLKRFQDMTLRLQTFNLLSVRLKINWPKFRQQNYMQLCQYLLLNEDCMAAAAVFSRHYYSFSENITSESMKDFLQNIPNSLHPTRIMPCLRHFIPVFLQNVPSALVQIVNWATSKALTFEVMYKQSWPYIGKEFCEVIIELCQPVDHDLDHVIQSSAFVLENLIKLKNTLEEMITLVEKYNIIITIAKFLQPEFSEVALFLLKKVPVDHIDLFLKDFLSHRLCMRNIDQNQLLENYISNYLNKREKDKQWESKMSAFAKHITNETTAMECIIKILGVANLPWSPIIQDLYEHGASSQHILASKVIAICKFSAVRFIQNKYFFEGFEGDDKDEILLLVECVLTENKPDAMQDIQQLVEAQIDIKTSIYERCLLYCLHMGNYERCIYMINNLLDDDCKKVCSESVIRMCEIMLLSKKPLNEKDGLYFQFLNSIKLQAQYCDSVYSEKLPILENLYLLKTKFDVHLSYDDYCRQNGFGNILNEVVQKTINNYQSSDEMFDHLKEFTYICDIKLETALIELCKQTSNLGLVLDCTRRLLLVYSPHKKSDEVVELVAHLINLYGKENINSQLLQNNSVQDNLDLVYRYAIDLMNIYFYDCKYEVSLSLLLFHKWISLGTECIEERALDMMKSETENYKMPSMGSIYRDTSTFSDNKNIRKIISLMISNIFSKPRQGLNLSTIFKESSSNCLSLLGKVPSNLYLTTLRIMQLLNVENDGSVDQKYIQEKVALLVEKIIVKMAGRNKFDIDGALSVLQQSASPDQVCEKLITLLSSQPLSQNNIATLAQEFHGSSNPDQCAQNYSNLVFRRKCCTWGIKLKNLNLIIPDAMSNRQKWLGIVLKKLYTLPASYSLLKEFCEDFEQVESLDGILVKQLIHYLSGIKLNFKPLSDKLSKPGIHVNPSEDEIMKICLDYTNNITNSNKLVAEIEELISVVSPYDYETYIVILRILKKFKSEDNYYGDWLEVLKFLKNYTRFVPYCQVEHEAWLQCQSDGDIDPLSKYRMPFLNLLEESKVFDIIKHEINVKSCEKWLEIVQFLPIKNLHSDIKDRLCQYAIKNTMLSIYKPSASENEWCLTMVQKETRDECYKIISLIKNMERVSALMYFIMNYSKPGADIVEAAKACYDFAPTCANMKKLQVSVEKMQRKYPLYARKHILFTHKLNEPHLMQLLEEPHQLIIALYNHPAVLKSVQLIISDLPDINKIVRQISEINKSVNLDELKIDLLNQWLQSNINHNMDDSMTIQNLQQMAHNKDTNLENTTLDEDLLRACYILRSYNKKEAIEFLGKNIYDSAENSSTVFKLRALQCMFYVCEPEVIEEVLHINLQQLQKLLDNLTVINYLDCVGLSYSSSDFNECNKELLIQYLLKNCINNTIAMNLCVKICQNYKITSEDFWCHILEALISLRMVKELRSSLTWLRAYPRLLSLPVITRAWHFIIRLPFIEADIERNPEQEKSCAEALLSLQRCPVAHSIDLLDLAECCINADRPYMAAALLPLASNDVKQNILKLIRSKSTSEQELETNIECLEELGILFVHEALLILKNE